jgi:hypothetical protein
MFTIETSKIKTKDYKFLEFGQTLRGSPKKFKTPRVTCLGLDLQYKVNPSGDPVPWREAPNENKLSHATVPLKVAHTAQYVLKV